MRRTSCVANAWISERFDYTTTSRVKCKACGAEMDTRGGRARQHYEKMHGEVEAAPPEREVEGKATGSVVGSREWAISEVIEIAKSKNATHEQKLKALDLLKDYEQYGSKRLDDQKEAEESLAQWERVFAKTDGLKKAEDKLLKDVAVRERLRMSLGA